MPDYRDNYQNRRPPQRFSQRRRPYDDFQPESRSGRRMGEDDGYMSGRDRRPAPDRFGMDDGYRSRRTRPVSAVPGEYLADSSQDRYAVFSDETDARKPDYDRARTSAPEDDFVDFSDLDSFDADDDWFAQRTGASRPIPVEPEMDRQEDEYFSDDFDGFDDDLNEPPAPMPRSRRNDGWFEESDRDDLYDRTTAFQSFNAKNNSKKRGTLIAVICCAAVVLIVVGVVLAVSASRSRVMLPLDTILESITTEQAQVMVSAYADKRLSEISCNVTVDGKSAVLKLADCEMTYAGYDTDVSTRYVTGTNEATGEITRTEYAVDGIFRYNKTALRSFLDALIESESVPVVDPHFEIDYETGKMTVYAGTDGWGVDIRAFLSQLASGLMAVSGDTVSLSCSSGAVAAQPLSAAEIYKQAATKPVDAYTTTDSAGQTIYHSEINGVDFSQSQLEQLIASGGTQWEMDVQVTRPEIDLKEIKKYTFPDLLATYFTYYSPGNVTRSSNLALSAEHINSTILEPGEQFSFNDVVGERTPENGFKIATVYLGEGTAEDYGGGICQTSSTLYYTCILANLKIDERSNHMYTVNYMQSAEGRRTVYGNDATVNWGYTDYKFSNNKEYPIRIDMVAKDGILTCEIRGTADGSTADFQYEILGSTPYMIKYMKNDGSPDQEGHTGYRVNVYRVIYQDGVQVDRVLESQNRYEPMTRINYTNDLPEGFEYGVEYPQDYVPPSETTTTTTTATTAAPTAAPTAAEDTTATAAP